jgi:predicted nuclease with TOPRIM domain
MDQELREQIAEIQSKIAEIDGNTKLVQEQLLQEISLFSETTMRMTNLNREKQLRLREIKTTEHQISQFKLSEDYDELIRELEEELSEQERIELFWKNELNSNQKNHPQQLKQELETLEQKCAEEFREEKIRDEEFQEKLKIEIEQLESEYQKIQMALAEIEHHNSLLDESILEQENQTPKLQQEVDDIYQLMMTCSFAELDEEELENLSKYTNQEDLYYASQVRLGCIAYQKENFYKSFIHFSEIPLKILQNFGFEKIYQKNKAILLNQHPGILSSHRFIEMALQSSSLQKKEVFLLLATQLQDNFYDEKPYRDLLRLSIQQEAWFKSQNQLDKLRQYFQRKQKKSATFNPADMVNDILIFHDSYLNNPCARNALRLQQMSVSPFLSSCFRFDLNALHQVVLEDKNATPFEKILSHLNINNLDGISEELTACSVFLKAWCELLRANQSIKAKKPAQAELHLCEALKLSPYFQEARVAFEKLSSQFSWPQFFDHHVVQIEDSSCSSKI